MLLSSKTVEYLKKVSAGKTTTTPHLLKKYSRLNGIIKYILNELTQILRTQADIEYSKTSYLHIFYVG